MFAVVNVKLNMNWKNSIRRDYMGGSPGQLSNLSHLYSHSLIFIYTFSVSLINGKLRLHLEHEMKENSSIIKPLSLQNTEEPR